MTENNKEPEITPEVTETNPFNQLVVWEGTLVGPEQIEEFEATFLKEGFRLKYSEEVKTLPSTYNGKPIPDTGDRNDLFFFIHDDDIGKFAIPSKAWGMRWWEDVLNNGGRNLYSDEIINKYPKTW